MENDELFKFWAMEFPFGFEEFVKGLAHEKRLAIASLLIEKKELRFSQIQKELGLRKNVLSQHLNTMLDYGLIRRTKSVWKVKEEIFKSFYKLNPIYRNVIRVTIAQLNFPLSGTSDEFLSEINVLEEKFETGSVKGAPLKPSIIKGLNNQYSTIGIGGVGKWQK